jgi:hypothetical protein
MGISPLRVVREPSCTRIRRVRCCHSNRGTIATCLGQQRRQETSVARLIPPGETSRAAVPTSGQEPRRGCIAKRCRKSSQLPHESERPTRSKDATGTRPCALRSCGRFVVALYNAERPHSSLGSLTPLAYAACLQSPSSQRDRTLPLSGGSASCPVASAAESGFTDPGTLASTG